jgi:hypothetical protein
VRHRARRRFRRRTCHGAMSQMVRITSARRRRLSPVTARFEARRPGSPADNRCVFRSDCGGSPTATAASSVTIASDSSTSRRTLESSSTSGIVDARGFLASQPGSFGTCNCHVRCDVRRDPDQLLRAAIDAALTRPSIKEGTCEQSAHPSRFCATRARMKGPVS